MKSFASLVRSRRPWRIGGLEPLEPRVLLASDVIIAEFQARNTSTIQDEDGDYPDWIELRNTSDAPIDLQGWFLTDDPDQLQKWQFPPLTLEAGNELLVFSSGKSRVDPRELHTNFRLSGNGEYLALVQPDGVTIAQDFGEEFPPQIADQSYGVESRRITTPLLGSSADVSAFVPTNGLLEKTWTEVNFDDSTWRHGAGGVGFERLRRARVEREPLDEPLSEIWTIDLPAQSGSSVTVTQGAMQLSVPTEDKLGTSERGQAPIVYRSLPDDAQSDWEIVAEIHKPNRRDRGAVGLAIFDPQTGRPAFLLEQRVTSTFQMADDHTTYGTWIRSIQDRFFLRIARNEIAGTWTGFAKLNADDAWTLVGTVTDGVGRAPHITDPQPAVYARGRSGKIDAHVESLELHVGEQYPTYTGQIDLDVEDDLFAKQSSVYLRLPFEWNAETAVDVIELGTQFDDGFQAYLNGVPIAAANVPSDIQWNSVAPIPLEAFKTSGQTTRFVVEHDDQLLQNGTNVLAVHGLNVAIDDADFFFQTTMTGSQLLAQSERFYRSPTPGAPNELPLAPKPDVITNEGLFVNSRQIKLELPEPQPTLEIRYTLDGSDPTPTSNLYTAPFNISSSTMLQARTFDTLELPNFAPSDAATATLIAASSDLVARESELPLLIVDTLTGSVPSTASSELLRTNVLLVDIDASTETASFTDSVPNYLGRAGIRRRGNSTGSQPKPNLSFETWGADGATADDGENVSLLGLPEENDWVLHAPYEFDRAMMRNQLGFELARQMNQWAPRSRFVEVFLNDGDGVVTESDYVGVYVLLEKIKQGADRVDITEISPADESSSTISGGYIWKIDRVDPDSPGFSAGGQNLNWVFPKGPLSSTARDDQKATLTQQTWVQEYFDAFQRSLESPNLHDPEGYGKYIDVNVWIDQHILNTLMWNVDAFTLSAFLHKDRDEPIKYGPLWDLDRSAESTDERDDDPRNWGPFFSAPWWRELTSDSAFWEVYVDRWNHWRQSVLADGNVRLVIDQLAANLPSDATNRNSLRWPEVAPRNAGPYFSGELDGTFNGEVKHLTSWIMDRLAFLDSRFIAAPQISVNQTDVTNQHGIAVNAMANIDLNQPGTTTQDHTIVSGAPGTTIGRFFVPLDDQLADTWTEVEFDDHDWTTGPLGVGFDAGSDFAEFIKTQLDPRVHDGATNILTRIEFEVNDLKEIRRHPLILRMIYDDGFVAYLNGKQIARDGIDASNVYWNTRSGVARSDKIARNFRELNISQHVNLLRPDTNVLAFRLVNSSSSSNDIVLLPELVSRVPLPEVNPDIEIFYTVDGSDPRARHGKLSTTAFKWTDETLLSITENTRLVARSRDTTPRGDDVVLTNWSAPTQLDLVVTPSPLVISEFDYHPSEPTSHEAALIPDEDADGIPDWAQEDFEFVELYNTADVATDLIGIQFDEGIDLDLSNANTTTVPPRQYALVVSNRDAFQLRYGANLPVVAQFAGQLSNRGERLSLADTTGNNLHTVDFADRAPWPEQADGQGNSLHLLRFDNLANRADSWEGKKPTPGMEYGIVGDLNADGAVNDTDIDQLAAAILDSLTDPWFDINQDRSVDRQDLDFLVRDILGANYGDSNLDGRVNSADIVLAFQAGGYEDHLVRNSRWASGDWNGDGEFTSDDLVFIASLGVYE